jgi:hypothetical protein
MHERHCQDEFIFHVVPSLGRVIIAVGAATSASPPFYLRLSTGCGAAMSPDKELSLTWEN